MMVIDFEILSLSFYVIALYADSRTASIVSVYHGAKNDPNSCANQSAFDALALLY